VSELERMLRAPAVPRSGYVYPRWAQRWPTTWIRLAIYYVLSWPATLLLGYPRVRGRDNLAGVRGPVLVVANHITSIDIGYILAALPGRFRHRLAIAMEGERLAGWRNGLPGSGLAARLLWRVIYILVTALFNVFPLPQRGGFRQSFIYAGESADRRYNVLVFPEGERTPDGHIHPFRPGIGLLALGLNLPVVPMRIDGLFELKQAHRWFTRPGSIRVAIGAPVRFSPGTHAEDIALELQRRVASLC
jgi:long-chain acyl-CoA synthetase